MKDHPSKKYLSVPIYAKKAAKPFFGTVCRTARSRLPLLNFEAEEEKFVSAPDTRDNTHLPPKGLAGRPAGSPRAFLAALLLLTALAAVLIDGYHPSGEDAGIYVAGIKQVLRPGIFGSSAAFISPYFRLSFFPEFNAQVVRLFHLPLPYALFALQILTTWLLVYALWELAKRCFLKYEERLGALLLATVCLSLPVAGSSIYLMDPYLTGRSYSSPLALLAITACLDRKIASTVVLLILASVLHPLMGLYATCFVLLLWAVNRGSSPAVAGLAAAAIGAGALVQYSQRHVVESPAYLAAVATRSYYFLSRWQWYEQFGVVAPLLLLAIYLRWRPVAGSRNSIVLAKTCLIAGGVSISVALLFARPSSHSHLISALQTIRPFLWIYFCMFVVLGGLLGRFWLKRSVLRWIVFFAAAAFATIFVQHSTYPASAQIELPWVASRNGWNRAFLWIEANTPPGALFALDADYIQRPGEDAQGFRVLAERNSLADSSKDGGAAAAFPELADKWWIEQTATTGLDRIDDAERLRRLTPFHVDWVVLDALAPTNLTCPFVNDAARVCRLR